MKHLKTTKKDLQTSMKPSETMRSVRDNLDRHASLVSAIGGSGSVASLCTCRILEGGKIVRQQDVNL